MILFRQKAASTAPVSISLCLSLSLPAHFTFHVPIRPWRVRAGTYFCLASHLEQCIRHKSQIVRHILQKQGSMDAASCMREKGYNALYSVPRLWVATMFRIIVVKWFPRWHWNWNSMVNIRLLKRVQCKSMVGDASIRDSGQRAAAEWCIHP